MVNENTIKAVNDAIESAPKRKFTESVDLVVNLKNIDLSQPKKPDYRVDRAAERTR
jgi:large subunit ribosomal protein L1